MKKLKAVICIVLAFVLMLPCIAAAYTDNSPFNLKKSSPTVNGWITSNEGWSSKGVFDETHTGYFEGLNALTSVGEFYFAYDNTGLYFAFNMWEYGSAYTLRFYSPNKYGDLEWVSTRSYIDVNAGEYWFDNYPRKNPDGTTVDGALVPPAYNEVLWNNDVSHKTAFWYSSCGNTVEYCTGKDGSPYAFDGDVIALSIDPLGIFRKSGKGNSYAPQFNIGVFEGDVVKVCTSRYSDRYINAKAAGRISGNNLMFEVMIPWDEIVKESNTAAKQLGVNHTFTKTEMITGIGTHNAAVTLMDRFNDPEAGYVDNWGRNITVCKTTDDRIAETSTSGDVIKAMGLKLNIQNAGAGGFYDVPYEQWYTEAVVWCKNMGYITGTSATTFNPNGYLTRAMIVQILAKVEGVNLANVKIKSPFDDVASNSWYAKAVQWAVNCGVTSGVGYNQFWPNALVTREEFALMLFAYSRYKGYDTKRTNYSFISEYSDGWYTATWASNAMNWAIQNGIISGTNDKKLLPKGVTTRAQAATMIMKYVKYCTK